MTKIMTKIKFAILSIAILAFSSCRKNTNNSSGKLKVVTTTTMITDMLTAVGGENIEVQGLMGSGVDPHLYKASEGDLSKLINANIIFYNGLHLEGKLEDIFEKMHQRGKNTIAISDCLDKKELIVSENFVSNYDPHIWFNIDYWIACTTYVANQLATADAKNASIYQANATTYIQELKKLQNETLGLVSTLPAEQRVLITAHDAFNYFGKAYDFEVLGLQGLSTATEAGVQDVQNLAKVIIAKNVKAIFVESSVPKRTVEALQAAVNAKGYQVKIGGELYSDALGTKNTTEGTYIGMYRHNVSTIVNALK